MLCSACFPEMPTLAKAAASPSAREIVGTVSASTISYFGCHEGVTLMPRKRPNNSRAKGVQEKFGPDSLARQTPSRSPPRRSRRELQS